METKKIHFLAPIWNVDRSLLHVRLPDDFAIEAQPSAKFFNFLERIDPLQSILLQNQYESEYWHAAKPLDEILAVTKTFELPSNYKEEEWYDSGEYEKYKWWEQEVTERLEHFIMLLRLVKSGGLFSPVQLFYTFEEGEPEMDYMTSSFHFPEMELFTLRKNDLETANDLLAKNTSNIRSKHVALAAQQFDQSYHVHSIPLQFLTLMISMEVLFNDGKQELRNKVSRNAAVFLGRTRLQSARIFKTVKSLYDKRSVLVHTGVGDSITEVDVADLRVLARKAIVELLYLKFSKDELIQRLNECGFGCWHKSKRS
ncbi:hypothetical protein KI811_11335 [Geobacter hydrogenophilus]|uniref:Apea-like HEPN domain-containing protein n=1 Tax=Geobacter hydrogenophilus TaxID=40983 RepID=A0A9W6G356_9BACT|nr:HEPN domain-containing protein [Geobacter hydrogenophilus]MBT0894401.1 hypothetical protein [Geobacter hydrogenophilus]GLI39443.1 hypothetical protein GHYDROH2_29440 [Geobacter hydrogenophilus]